MIRFYAIRFLRIIIITMTNTNISQTDSNKQNMLYMFVYITYACTHEYINTQYIFSTYAYFLSVFVTELMRYV